MKKQDDISTIGDMPNLDAFVQKGTEIPPVAAEKPAEATVMMTVRTPVSLHQRIKIHCVTSRQSIQEYALKAIEKQLAEDGLL